LSDKLPELTVIFENKHWLAVNKIPKLSVERSPYGEPTIESLVFDHISQSYKNPYVGIIHRLDRVTTGVLLFAKRKSTLRKVNEQFRNRTTEKTYLAVVGVAPPEKEARLIHYLRKDGRKNISVASDEEAKGAKRAELHYRLLGSSERYHLLEVKLTTGRHHQIRAQLAAIGCPIKGDVKYGFRRSNRDRSIHLHAWKLGFEHPVSQERVELSAPPPSDDAVWDAFVGFTT